MVHISSGVREWKWKTPLLRSVGSACFCLRKASIPQRPTHIMHHKKKERQAPVLWSTNNVETLLWLDQCVILLFYEPIRRSTAKVMKHLLVLKIFKTRNTFLLISKYVSHLKTSSISVFIIITVSGCNSVILMHPQFFLQQQVSSFKLNGCVLW